MLIKLIGASIIFTACTYGGLRKSGDLKARYDALCGIAAALLQLETEISFCANDLKRAFLNIDKNTRTHGLFRDAAEHLEEYGIKKAWAYAVMKNPAPMTDDDRELVLMLASKLGMTDTKNQLKHIGFMKELVNARSAAAKNEYDRLGKIYRSGGLLAGLFIILVII